MPLTLLDRLERRFGWLAVPHVTITLIVGQAVLYFVGYMGANGILPGGASIDRVFLVPSLVMEGQVWRLATFVFQPPGMIPIFAVFYFSLLYTFGTALETQWGTFKYNLFLLIGYVANVAAAFLGWYVLQQQIGPEGNEMLKLAAIPASNVFLYSSIFLAFARLYPDFIIRLFFVLPIRIQWLALMMWILFAYVLLRGDWMIRMLVLATVLNYILFFGREHIREWKQGHRRRSFQSAAKRAVSPAKHACAVCGLSSAESPRTLFRYCSKCSGQRCYCPDHIRDHEHVVDKEPVV
ncbi:hypothetical protein [Lacipirellula parvula]|uniref:Peptidase S54 rhomboid domain-containing protein n=1 Tax=Lacipirellula parvula TaxID=2650471 RepID=A0A5K7XFY8_9BACT|nr:hypothetical protein [Lacipirellula parvula]BBO34967.1 hypothetical protein PLANPX_4579 [Lacipirellula parvula]